jgi:poly-gamma-glutamate capsule biosynthesis protein CapA/YwtB (metallophosphatase superfamily)
VSAKHARRRRRSGSRPHVWRRLMVGASVLVVLGATAFAIVWVAAPAHQAGGSHAGGTSTTLHPAHPATTTTLALTPVTLSAVGDTDLGNTPNLPPDPTAYLQPVKAALQGPIVFANLEGTLTDATASKCSPTSTQCYAFRNPPSDALVLKATGFTVINSANNHSHDFGSQGLADTTAALQGSGLVQAGLPGQIGIVTDGTTKVAFVDFAPYPNTNNLLDLPTAKSLILQAKAEANVVVVYMHAGAEGSAADHVTGSEETYVGEDRGNAKAFAHAAIDDGANLVIASGPHVLRGMEEYNGHLIAYSLGNFCGYQNFATGGTLSLSGVLTVTMTGAGVFTGGHFTSVLLNGVGQPSVDPSGQAAGFVNGLSSADFGASAVTILPSGQISLPAPAA